MVGNMAKDVGTAICKSTVVLFLPCSVTFFEIPALHASSFFNVFCDFVYMWYKPCSLLWNASSETENEFRETDSVLRNPKMDYHS